MLDPAEWDEVEARLAATQKRVEKTFSEARSIKNNAARVEYAAAQMDEEMAKMKSAIAKGKPPPETPTNVRAERHGSSAHFSWDNAPRADYYELYGPDDLVKRVPGTTAIDHNAGPGARSYRVVAGNVNGPSPPSAVVKIGALEDEEEDPGPIDEEPGPIDEDEPPRDDEEEPGPIDEGGPPVGEEPGDAEDDEDEEQEDDPDFKLGPDTPNPAGWKEGDSSLPQAWDWSADLRRELVAAIRAEEVTLPSASPAFDTAGPAADVPELFIELRAKANANQMYDSGKLDVLEALPEAFTLEYIEGGPELKPVVGGNVRIPRHFNTAAYWFQRSIKSSKGAELNPLYGLRALGLRALVAASVDMILSDWWHYQKVNPWGKGVYAKSEARFLGGLMEAWAYTYRHCGHLLTATQRAAFLRGLVRQMGKLRSKTVNRTTPNMQTRVVSAMAEIYVGVNDPEVRAAAEAIARKYATGLEDGIYPVKVSRPNSLMLHASIQEGFGYESTYNGVSTYHMAKALFLVPAWESWGLEKWLIETLEWRTHQMVGGLGPSGWAGRSGQGVENFQASHPWSVAALAATYPEYTFYGHRLLVDSKGLFDLARMRSGLKASFNSTSRIGTIGNRVNAKDASPYAIDQQHHWPNYVPYHAPAGWYDRLVARIKADDPLVRLPYNRAGYTFNRNFGRDFWGIKTDAYQAWIETNADGGTYGGFRGGSLQAFYAPGVGPAICSRKNKSSNDVIWSKILSFPCHQLALRTSKGWATTAAQRKRRVEYVSDKLVRIDGPLDSKYQQAPTDIDVGIAFELLERGLRLSRSVQGEGVLEAWETLPGLLPSTIEYLEGGEWKPLETKLVLADRVRIAKGSGHVHIELSTPTSVSLSPEEWVQTYQGSSRVRNLIMDARDGIAYQVVVP